MPDVSEGGVRQGISSGVKYLDPCIEIVITKGKDSNVSIKASF